MTGSSTKHTGAVNQFPQSDHGAAEREGLATVEDVAAWLHDYDYGADHEPAADVRNQYEAMARALLSRFRLSSRQPQVARELTPEEYDLVHKALLESGTKLYDRNRSKA